MKLVTYRTASSGPRPGAILPGGHIADLDVVRRDVDLEFDSIKSLLGLGAAAWQPLAGRLESLAENPAAGIEAGSVVREQDVELLPPTGPRPFIVACGGMFASHLKEMGLAPVPPARPDGYIVSPNTVIGHGQPIVLPEGAPNQVDWEGELCVVFGRPTYRVTVDQAMDHVAGYTIFNDVSARDAVDLFLNPPNPGEAVKAFADNVRYKGFPTFGPLGPCIATCDELRDIGKSRLVTSVNGQVMQDELIGDLLLSIAEVIAIVTQIYTFEVGDVMSLGTPGGVGYGRSPQVFLAPGDVVEVSVDGIGTLRNPVAASAGVATSSR